MTDSRFSDPAAPPIRRLLAIMAQLRNPDGGCPWDQEQTFETIAPHTIEEAYEVADAIHHGDMMHLKDELGDLLFQVVFYAQIASENGDFAFDDVVEAICAKMLTRHPHVFGSADIASSAAQTVAWEEQKAAERQAKAAAENRPESALDGVSVALPALTRAFKIGKRARRVGFDWPDADAVTDKVHEELKELRDARAEGESQDRITEEMGDLLFTLVNLARHLDVDPETALRKANIKVEDRFRLMEQDLAAQGKTVADVSMDERETAWERAKAASKT